MPTSFVHIILCVHKEASQYSQSPLSSTSSKHRTLLMSHIQNVNLYSHDDLHFAPWMSMLDSHANGNTACYHCQYYQHCHNNYHSPSGKFVDYNLRSCKLLLGLYFLSVNKDSHRIYRYILRSILNFKYLGPITH